MKIVTFLCLLYLLCTVPMAIGQTSNCSTTDKKINKALEEAFSATTFDQQVQGLAAVVSKYPQNVQAYFYLGQLHYQRGMALLKQNNTRAEGEQLLQKALVFYQASIQKCPSHHSDAYYYAARLLYNFSEKAAALTYLETFMNFDSLYPGEQAANYNKFKEEILPVYKELRFPLEAKSNPVPFNVARVNGVSTKQDEYFPMLSPDNNLLFFTRKADKTNLGDISGYIQEEFTVAESQTPPQFTIGKALPHPFNDGQFSNYGSASLSADNRELVLCACKAEKVYNKDYLNCDLYSSRYQLKKGTTDQYEWTTLVNLGANINTKDGWEAQPSLSADGKILYFTTLRKGSQDNDIYYSEKQTDGTWGLAKPFSIVNTSGKDKSPFFHQDGETFYFVSESSRLRPGMGGLDIYMMRKEANGWGPIQNIGYPINTTADELGLFVSTDGKQAYFSSQQDQNWDIFSFELHEAARPKETRILTGKLQDVNGTHVSDAKITVRYEGPPDAQQTTRSNEDGSYAIAVRVDQKISLEASKENFSFQAQIISADQLQTRNLKIETSPLQIDSLQEGSAYAIEAIVFDTDAALLSPDAQLLLQGFASYLQSQQGLQIQINGHTDDIGDAARNQILSEERAKAVAAYLEALGVNASRMQYKGFGEAQPRVENNSAANRALNRRTEFEIISIQ
jgi:outer membrane protein OmpA-like peptidoglycan-associated protein/Tol biopolymer transport system component